MSDGLLEGFVKQIPEIGALIFIVMVFLKYITTRDREQREVLERMGKTHTDIMDRQMEIIRENSTALARVASVMESCVSIERNR